MVIAVILNSTTFNGTNFYFPSDSYWDNTTNMTRQQSLHPSSIPIALSPFTCRFSHSPLDIRSLAHVQKNVYALGPEP